MTSTNSLSLILRRLNEVESKLDRMMEELRTLNTPTAIGYSARGQPSKEGQLEENPAWQRRTNLWRERTNLRPRAAAPRGWAHLFEKKGYPPGSSASRKARQLT